MKNARMFGKFGILAMSALFCCASGLAQHGGGGGGGGSQGGGMQSQSAQNGMQSMQSDNTAEDSSFVKKALQGSMAEVQVAQLALQKGSDDRVKQFAQRMVTDHTQMIEDMKQVAQQIGTKIPDGPDKKQKAMMAKLQTLSGADFDKAYVQAMVKDHKEDDAAFKTEIAHGQSQAVKDAASKADPIIESHLQVIQGLAKDMNVGSGI